jgi:AcrR family transcriptional regulator
MAKAVPALRRAKPRLSRAERSEQTRKALFAAAARVVGRHGYAGASIARITAEAGVAQGTFYIYFASRQDLLDQLLPSLGEAFVASIVERVRRFSDGEAREAERLRAFFDYAHEHPEFFRILHEAEMFAPEAHRRHLLNLEAGYVRALKSSWIRGEMPGFAADELEAVTYILMAARDYLAMKYSFGDGKPRPMPERVIATYMKLMRHGLFGGGPAQGLAPRRSGSAQPGSRRSSPAKPLGKPSSTKSSKTPKPIS